MHAYEKIMNDPNKKNAVIMGISHIIEIEWNVKADPVGKFLECVELGHEKYTDKIRFMNTDTDEIFAAWKDYAADPEMKAALYAAWNHVRNEHLLKLPDYGEYVKFYHRDEEDPKDPPEISIDDIRAWVDDYADTRR